MKLTFVSHAGVLLEVNGRRILTDPWTCGKTFNDGWALLSPAYEVDYRTLDYLFVSHEHPDHFNLPTLKSIPSEEKKRIRVLYQRHTSPRLVNAWN
jgi:L-ascorbate metabolism protein UlaG (beta-lactamase superfamily)